MATSIVLYLFKDPSEISFARKTHLQPMEFGWEVTGQETKCHSVEGQQTHHALQQTIWDLGGLF